MTHTTWFKILIILALILIGSSIILTLEHNAVSPQKNSLVRQSVNTVTMSPTITPSITASPTPTVSQTAPTLTPLTAGTPQGQLTCNYQSIAVGYQDGIATISSHWTNATLGKSGSARIDVCVSTNNGPQSLMSTDTSQNGSRNTTVPWIIVNAAYLFTLFDDNNDGQTNCDGLSLSSCQIGFTFPTPTPTH
jgi:hypothetical protein